MSVVFNIVGFGFLVLSLAAFFGLNEKVTITMKQMSVVKDLEKNEVQVSQPSYTSAGSAPGFAIASGLCFLAAALAPRKEKSIRLERGEQEPLGRW